MLLSEKGLTRALKDAYKGGGYTINNTEGQIQIYMGQLPTEEGAWNLSKAGEAQSVMQTKVGEDVARWELGNHELAGVQVMVVPMSFCGVQVLQARMKGYACYGVQAADLSIVSNGDSAATNAVARGNDLLYREDGNDDVIVVLQGVRPSDRAKEGVDDWTVRAWTALEAGPLSADRAKMG